MEKWNAQYENMDEGDRDTNLTILVNVPEAVCRISLMFGQMKAIYWDC